MNRYININGRKVGPGCPAYIVAEMSANHNMDFGRACEILVKAKEAGADAVKVQTYTADSLTIACEKKYFKIEGTVWQGRTLYDLYKEAYTPWEWQPKLKQQADQLGLDFFSTPFDNNAVDFLEGLDLPVHKIASFEIVDLALLQKIAATGKPIIMSTGMASLAEIDEAVCTIKESGNEQLALLKCTSAYPAPMEEMNLATLPHLAEAFGCVTGLSDHSTGIAVPLAAVALGAAIIEKHFTLSRADGGPDSAFSLEPVEFMEMVRAVRDVESAIGGVCYDTNESEEKSKAFRRSLFVVKDIKKGERFSEVNVRSIRPSFGLHTRYLDEVLGREASKNISRGTPLSWSLVG